MTQIEERQKEECQSTKTGTEDRERIKAGWCKAELLDPDTVTEPAEVFGDEVTGSCCVGRAGFPREGQEMPRDLVDRRRRISVSRQDDAARFERRPATKALPAAVKAAR